jgi:thiosulfate/3-mercaptopyruvate sulfurtransferase
MPYTTLVSASDLVGHLDDTGWVIVDCRFALDKPEASYLVYREAHIPGSRYMHLDQDLSGKPNGKNGRHPLPDPQVFMGKVGSLGIDANKQVVTYDDGSSTFAARLWWMLRWVGHDGVAVLDGGWAQWLKDGFPQSSDTPQIKPAIFKGSPNNSFWVDVQFVADHLHDSGFRLLDARSPERFAGIGEVLHPVAGHIPGAVNHFYRDNLDRQSCFKSIAQLREMFEEDMAGLSPRQVVHQCGSGVSACQNLLAMEIAGLAGSRLYPGSWSEWCSDPARPISTEP